MGKHILLVGAPIPALIALTALLVSALVIPHNIDANTFITTSLSRGRFHFYHFNPTESQTVVTLITASGDADLYVSTVEMNPDQRNHMAFSILDSHCDQVIISASRDVYIGIYGYVNSEYSLIVTQLTDSDPIPGGFGLISVLSSTVSSVRLSWSPAVYPSTGTEYRLFMLPYSNTTSFRQMVQVDSVLAYGKPLTEWSTATMVEVNNLPTSNASVGGATEGIKSIFQVVVRNSNGLMSTYAFRAITPGATSNYGYLSPFFESVLQALWVIMGATILIAAFLVICTWACVRRARRIAQMNELAQLQTNVPMYSLESQCQQPQPVPLVLITPGHSASPKLLFEQRDEFAEHEFYPVPEDPDMSECNVSATDSPRTSPRENVTTV